MSTFISKAGSGSCATYSSSAQCSATDYYNADNYWYISTTSVYVHGWGTVYTDSGYGYVFLEAASNNVLYNIHWDISYDSPSSDAMSYGSQVNFYGGQAINDYLYLCARTSNGAEGGISASW